eukprot:scaffold2764_cov399-Prasinococcus_capsulatus_cf.AAC.10
MRARSRSPRTPAPVPRTDRRSERPPRGPERGSHSALAPTVARMSSAVPKGLSAVSLRWTDAKGMVMPQSMGCWARPTAKSERIHQLLGFSRAIFVYRQSSRSPNFQSSRRKYECVSRTLQTHVSVSATALRAALALPARGWS